MDVFMRRLLLLLLALAALCPVIFAGVSPDWTTPLAPFQIADNVYYVGSRDLAAYLITTPAGNILINANLESSPPLIRASIEKLGFRYADTRILLDGQAHYDHMAGAAEILRETHARDMVMDADAEVVRTGGRADFAYKTDGIFTFPPARVDRVLHDGDTVTLGDPRHGGVTLTAHKTAGHTRGCTTWTLRAHIPGEPAGALRNIVIIGGMAALSQYSLIGHPTPAHPAFYPGVTADFHRTFATLRALPCDVFLGAHGVYFNMLRKLPRAASQGPSVWIDPQGYRAAVDAAERAFDADLAKQQAESAAH
jgi:metallo-beta-lactamase class B